MVDEIQRRREQRILRYGSPLFNFKNTTLGPGESEVFEFGERARVTQKYLPFNFLSITNNSTVSVEVNFEDKVKKTVPPGVIMSFESIWFRRVSIKNLDASNTANQNTIEITVQRLPVKEDISRMPPELPVIQKIKLLLFGG